MRRTFLVLLSIAAVSCTDPLAPLPRGAVALDPLPSQYVSWWSDVEQCSGLHGDLELVRFFVVPGASQIPAPGHQELVQGYWDPRGNEIVIGGFYESSALLVRHEMLHALLHGGGDHPPEYFRDKCGELVL